MRSSVFKPLHIIHVAAEDDCICTQSHTTSLKTVSICTAKLKNKIYKKYQILRIKNAIVHTLSNCKF